MYMYIYTHIQWHALGREEQAKYYELARRERQLHMQMYPDWSSRTNASRGKKRKRKQDFIDGGSYFKTETKQKTYINIQYYCHIKSNDSKKKNKSTHNMKYPKKKNYFTLMQNRKKKINAQNIDIYGIKITFFP